MDEASVSPNTGQKEKINKYWRELIKYGKYILKVEIRSLEMK